MDKNALFIAVIVVFIILMFVLAAYGGGMPILFLPMSGGGIKQNYLIYALVFIFVAVLVYAYMNKVNKKTE